MNKWRLIGGLLLLTSLLCFSLVGIKIDGEFGDADVFLKHRPALTWVFKPQIGDSDRSIEDLAPDQQAKEKLWQEFVVEHRKGSRSPVRGLAIWLPGLMFLGIFPVLLFVNPPEKKWIAATALIGIFLGIGAYIFIFAGMISPMLFLVGTPLLTLSGSGFLLLSRKIKNGSGKN